MLFALGTACKVLSPGDEAFGGKGDDAGGDWLLLVLMGVPGLAGVVLVSWFTDCNAGIDGTVGTGLEHAMFIPLPNWITSEISRKMTIIKIVGIYKPSTISAEYIQYILVVYSHQCKNLSSFFTYCIQSKLMLLGKVWILLFSFNSQLCVNSRFFSLDKATTAWSLAGGNCSPYFLKSLQDAVVFSCKKCSSQDKLYMQIFLVAKSNRANI